MRRLRLALALLLAGLAGTAPAQTIAHDVRLIVPYAPGGTVDLLGRLLAEGLAPRLGGRAVVVENRSGAGTFIALQAVAQTPADGHALALAATAVLATAPVMPGFVPPLDPDRALAPVTSLIRVPMVLVGRPDAPYASLAELIAHAKAHPGRLNIGNAGTGGQTHLLAARLAHEAGISMEAVQYRGGTPALLDVMAGHADLYFSLLPESLPFIRDGRLRPIAFASPARNPVLPEVPLVRETLDGFTGDVGYGLVAAAGTPPAWLAFWNAEINRVMARPEVQARMASLFWRPTPGTAAAYREEILTDRRVWGGVIAAARIRAGS
ncbi:Bug family tripartite tricarboxylate transporter substrate binding protein [Paeniroseomonas aquatica]|uniref:Tripartite tricarboxylate transporter substrate binding protein n=1 Tax=Paeniroseomonas aquatica TaxID=373043 RepID=A0ABT8AAJ7_9PROT|nr:tripartite tricarboxylate transporter substrate binding protein [Paeniroseomonas aquatica]MDN3566852.1 tripartite tricarboxylate transporter substrate binding protein [Paeniroseomonas aquatica]